MTKWVKFEYYLKWRVCFLSQCEHRSHSYSSKSFKAFPSNEVQRQKWINFITHNIMMFDLSTMTSNMRRQSNCQTITFLSNNGRQNTVKLHCSLPSNIRHFIDTYPINALFNTIELVEGSVECANFVSQTVKSSVW